MSKIKVLFLCIHNSARSQMAEAFLDKLGSGKFEVYSAGLEPGKLNPIVVEVMLEKGYDLSNKKTKSVREFVAQSFPLDYVITVCDESSAERCPIFPGKVVKEHWNFIDPSSFQGTKKEKINITRKIRDQIEERVVTWLQKIQSETK